MKTKGKAVKFRQPPTLPGDKQYKAPFVYECSKKHRIESDRPEVLVCPVYLHGHRCTGRVQQIEGTTKTKVADGMVRITVNGKAWHDCLDPRATNVPIEEGWPEASLRKVGRGVQAVYELAPAQAREMSTWLVERGELLMMDGMDEDAMADGRACLKAAESIVAQMSKAGVA